MFRKTRSHGSFQIEFIPLHISTFQENGVWFAKAEEFQIMGHADSEARAERTVFHMVLQAVAFAASEGRLDSILEKAGVTVRIGIPDVGSSQASKDSVWYMPIPRAA